MFGRKCVTWKQRNASSLHAQARLAQPAERKALNLVVVGSSPTVGGLLHVDKSPKPADARDVNLAIAGSMAAHANTQPNTTLQKQSSKATMISSDYV